MEYADAQNFSLGQKFDCIVAGEVIEYLPNLSGFFNSCFNHLYPDGRIILSTENPYSIKQCAKAIKRISSSNLFYLNPDNIQNCCQEIDQSKIEIEWIPPSKMPNKVLYKIGFKKLASEKYCVAIESNTSK